MLAASEYIAPIVTRKAAGDDFGLRGTSPLTHRLKTLPEPFAALWAGTKTCEVRRNDRDFRVDDGLELVEGVQFATGRELYGYITHIQSGYDLPPGTVLLSLKITGRTWAMPDQASRHTKAALAKAPQGAEPSP